MTFSEKYDVELLKKLSGPSWRQSGGVCSCKSFLVLLFLVLLFLIPLLGGGPDFMETKRPLFKAESLVACLTGRTVTLRCVYYDGEDAYLYAQDNKKGKKEKGKRKKDVRPVATGMLPGFVRTQKKDWVIEAVPGESDQIRLRCVYYREKNNEAAYLYTQGIDSFDTDFLCAQWQPIRKKRDGTQMIPSTRTKNGTGSSTLFLDLTIAFASDARTSCLTMRGTYLYAQDRNGMEFDNKLHPVVASQATDIQKRPPKGIGPLRSSNRTGLFFLHRFRGRSMVTSVGASTSTSKVWGGTTMPLFPAETTKFEKRKSETKTPEMRLFFLACI